ncbi:MULTISPECIES: efflux RND transporter periplasmic adaptor subunit [Stenotrophomonas]|jgi:membrane fusion protein, macrolide-specific efflux system|uniref:Efflux RND transporter periplasmic adaptor subunit n=1 Tax=Stenotrophomonas pavanii TaxID=487698 RepID=A0A246KXN6_9GAMM|nr:MULTISPECIES: efflux RND transporter periplasmic adaptor subunit [Stenotrophomonas]MBC9078263.1 efflux RND transporter periplasmic adaptor subunit [Stenotrophomonas maltophilia]MBC9090951.1 efflux RND transporter periplasmic adaptor subunit [Stenotrophomonas maltophilia]MBH1387301.1 efflux RND transporter periplasmic adaptor subunit [Stenotrophomonas maltophilia]MBH1519308.1 efflux RND transporter periplasmic adaptor subunit [Stenotrophomonas maltophilia]MBN4942548.1 efflux RND transporter 
MNNRRTWIIAATLAVLAGAGSWWAFADGDDAALITAPATVADLERTVQAVGRVNPKELVAVGAQVSGQVKRLHVVLGQHVQAGDLIAEVDSQPQRIALRSAEAAATALRAQHAASQARYTQALRTYDRQSQLVASRLVSQESFEAARVARDAARSDVAALQAQIDQAVTQVETARINLGYTRIVSPSAGYIVAIVTKAGQTLNSMQTTPTLVMLAQMDIVTVRAEIAEADVELIAPGQRLSFSTLGPSGRRYESHLQQLEPAPSSIADAASGNSGGSAQTPKAVYYAGLFDVANPGLMLKPSMTVKVTIQLARVANALQVPLSALTEAGDGAGTRTTVRVVDAKGRARERAVTTGLRTATAVQILSGLEAGENVVVGQASSGGDAEPTSLLGM